MVILLNHSYQHLINKLVVADIAPINYPEDNQIIIDILLSLETNLIKNRNHADEILSKYINEKFLTNFSNILRIYKKEKDIFYKVMLLFFVEYNFQKLKSQEMLNNKKLIEKRLMILKNINDFFLYNLNQNTLLSNLEENYFDD